MILLLAVSAGASTSELHPAHDPDHVGLGGGRIEITESRPRWRIRQRKWASNRPLYLSLHLGDADATIPGVVDESGGSGSGYDLVCVDTDGDGDLSDETALRPSCEKTGRTTSLRTDPVRVVVTYADGERRRLGVRIAVSGFRDQNLGKTAWSAQCHVAEFLVGSVDIGKRRNVKIAVLDRSFGERKMNACFNDHGVDRLRIDLDGNGTLNPENEDFPVSKVISVDGRLWELETTAAASRIAVRPCTLPVGRVRLSVKTLGEAPVNGRADLVSAEGYAFTYCLPEKRGMVVPEGKYRVDRATLSMADAEQRTWVAALSLTNAVGVERGRESTVQMGLPFGVEPATEGEFRLGDSACITAHLFGAAGEEYANVAPRRMRMKPKVRIEDAVEIVVAEGTMEYG